MVCSSLKRIWFSGKTDPCQGSVGSSILPIRTRCERKRPSPGLFLIHKSADKQGACAPCGGESNTGACFAQQSETARWCPERLRVTTRSRLAGEGVIADSPVVLPTHKTLSHTHWGQLWITLVIMGITDRDIDRKKNRHT